MPAYVIRDEGLAETKKVVRASRRNVDAIAAALLERETLSGDEVREVVTGAGK
jgi:ATP-dependent Zn protease